MNKAREQQAKAMIAYAFGKILQNKKERYKNILSLMGGEFGESEEESAIAWLGAGVYIKKTEPPGAVPCGETEKPAARRPLLRYPHEEAPQWGLHNTGGIR
jgi:hypothetical protein